MSDGMDERALVERICVGDEGAIEELLFNLCGSTLRRLSALYGYPDLLGELYLHLQEDDWRRLRTWSGRAPLAGWLKQVAAHLCIKKLKESRRFEPLENENGEMDRRLGIAADEDRRLGRMDLMRAIAALEDPRERLLIAEYVLLGRDLVDIAEGMKITRGNADVIKHRATVHLREWFLRRRS